MASLKNYNSMSIILKHSSIFKGTDLEVRLM